MFCPKCRKEIDDRSAFCNYCGARIVKIPEPVAGRQDNSSHPKTPFYKHWLFWVLFVLAIYLCGIAVTSGRSKNNSSPETGIHRETESTSPASDEVTIESQVIYSKNGVTITTTGIKHTGTKTAITLLVENSTQKNIAVGCSDFVVNGITVGGYMYISVAAGKKANGELSLYTDALDAAGIQRIATVSTYDAYISDTDTYLKAEYVSFSITTSAAEHTQSIDESGNILFSQDGITVIAKHINDSITGKTIIVLIKNNSGQDIIIQADNVSVNGYTISVLQSDGVPNGSVRFCEIYLSNSQLEENGIASIKTVTFTLKALNPSNFNTLLKTGELEVHFSN